MGGSIATGGASAVGRVEADLGFEGLARRFVWAPAFMAIYKKADGYLLSLPFCSTHWMKWRPKM